MDNSGFAWALLGPTASGKSRIALRLAARFPIEIVSVDSVQVYRGMDIGTAKPTRAERECVPHHLIDMVEPTESYSAGRFRADALAAVRAIHARGRLPLLVGGTMLYYRSLAVGLHALPGADVGLRAEIDAEAARRGWPALHDELAKIDPRTAQRIAPGDAQRIQRALEVIRRTGRPLSSLHAEPAERAPLAIRGYALVPADRAALHQHIAGRFDAMLAGGLVEEVESLRRRYPLTAQSPSMRSVGYRQVWDYLEGHIDRPALREKSIAATRQFAKRQMTWLRSFRELVTLAPGDAEVQLARDLETGFSSAPGLPR